MGEACTRPTCANYVHRRKYDKRVGGREGAAFLQHCWQGDNLKLGAILHSPLLSELQGLESRLRRTTGAALDQHLLVVVEVDGVRRSGHSSVRQVRCRHVVCWRLIGMVSDVDVLVLAS